MRFVFSITSLLFLNVAARANIVQVNQATPVRFDTKSYNFALTGGGGGEKGLLNSNLTVETFCDNFNNEINVGHSDYSAYISTPTDGSDLSHTRFASNTSWKPITLSDSNPNDSTDAAVINGANTLARYQMAAFLVSQYQVSQGSNASNNGIQGAVWDIFDPTTSPAAPAYAQPNAALEKAAEWYSNPNSDKSFLSDFLIISDATMTPGASGGPQVGGFQEQLTMILNPVPEPRSAAIVLIAFFALGLWLRRSRPGAQPLKIFR